MSGNANSIIDQFTKQAAHFAEMPGHNDELSLDHIADLVELSSTDEVLDVGCGSGIVARSFARRAARVAGIDLTPAMLSEASRLACDEGLRNVEWRHGDIENLPWPDGTFSLVVSRYAFHHVTNPRRVLAEMVRVAKPQGRVVVVDAVLPIERVEAYNAFEKLLDPSHSSALSFEELERLLHDSRLGNFRFSSYRMEMELEQQLSTSFPNEGDAERVRELVRNDIGIDKLGIGAHWRGSEIHYAYPVTIAVGEKLRHQHREEGGGTCQQ